MARYNSNSPVEEKNGVLVTNYNNTCNADFYLLTIKSISDELSGPKLSGIALQL